MLPAPGLGRSVWRPGAWFLLLLPVILLAGMVALFLLKGEVLVSKSFVPPDALLKVEFERLLFRPGEIVATVRNTGPDPVTIAQVAVNDALWQYAVSPGPTLARL
ncbi:MAG: ZIP family metal transporter, partial [candidate division NC10 bacterium]|nr:ZIP family metal transporter [candidate division NC10 bacterium]